MIIPLAFQLNRWSRIKSLFTAVKLPLCFVLCIESISKEIPGFWATTTTKSGNLLPRPGRLYPIRWWWSTLYVVANIDIIYIRETKSDYFLSVRPIRFWPVPPYRMRPD